MTPSAAAAAGFSASAAATFFFGGFLRLRAGEEGWSTDDVRKGVGEGIVMVSMEAWEYQSFGLNIQAGTESLRWCVVSFGWALYRTKAWRDMTASRVDVWMCGCVDVWTVLAEDTETRG